MTLIKKGFQYLTANPFFNMVPKAGLELATYWLQISE